MTTKVIQGSFLGGQPKLAAVQPRIAARPPIQAQTAASAPGAAFAGRPPGPPARAFGARPSGPPPAFVPWPEAVQRHGAGSAFAIDSGALGLASVGGKPLPDAVRGKMEAALGADFSGVRVHVGPQAERIGAIAFTVGSDIYFAPGRYQPDTMHGQQLLGHELAHVVQQRAGRVKNPLGSGLAVVQDQALEAEADRLGQRAAAHRVPARAKMPSGAAQPLAPVRISQPIGASHGSYRLTGGAGGRPVASAARTGQRFGKSKVTLAVQDNGSGRPAVPPPLTRFAPTFPTSVQSKSPPGNRRCSQVIQPSYYWYNGREYSFYYWRTATLTPGIVKKPVDLVGIRQEERDYRGTMYGVWCTPEVRQQLLDEMRRRDAEAARSAVVSIMDNKNSQAAATFENQYPNVTSICSLIGKAAMFGGIALMGGEIAAAYITFEIPRYVQLALNLTTLGLALLRAAKNRWRVYKAERNNEPVWQINVRDGFSIIVSTTIFCVEFFRHGWGLAFSGWLEDLYDAVVYIVSAIRQCCCGAPRVTDRTPLLQVA